MINNKMHPLELTGLKPIMNISSGSPDVIIGLLDGSVDVNHPAFQGANIKTATHSQLTACKSASDMACVHGTFVTGILSAKRGVSAPAICPDCSIFLNPIFEQPFHNGLKHEDVQPPSITPKELSKAITETIDFGAKIINLSAGLSVSSITSYDEIKESYDYALQKGVIIVVAAGNQGNIGSNPLVNHEWPIPVAACDADGRLGAISNFGHSIGTRGLMAPGINIKSAYPGGQYIHMSGTSFAAPFVTGALALLWSVFTKATAAELILALKRGSSSNHRHPSIIPPILNVNETYRLLKNTTT